MHSYLGRKLINYMQKGIFCPIAQNFLQVNPYFHGIIFRPQWPLPIALIISGLWSLKFLAIENMPPHFLAHVSYGQMAGWIRIPLGTEVGLGPGDIVLDGGPTSPTERGTASLLHFLPMFIVAKLLDASRYHLVWR